MGNIKTFNEYFEEKNNEYLELANKLAKEDFDIIKNPWRAVIKFQTDDDFQIEWHNNLIELDLPYKTYDAILICDTKKNLIEKIKKVLALAKIINHYGKQDYYKLIYDEHVNIALKQLKRNSDQIETGGGNHWMKIYISKRITNLEKLKNKLQVEQDKTNSDNEEN